VKRYGWVIRLRPNKACGIRNYSIFLKRLDDGRDYLFASFEYVGEDFAQDQARMAADPTTQKWWKLTDPLQEPIATRAEGEWWATMEEVFHHA
jgi:L-rhamnose mutarotase